MREVVNLQGRRLVVVTVAEKASCSEWEEGIPYMGRAGKWARRSPALKSRPDK